MDVGPFRRARMRIALDPETVSAFHVQPPQRARVIAGFVAQVSPEVKARRNRESHAHKR
jgi:hypothetical protein